MNTQQPTALRLADVLYNRRRWHELTDDECDAAAAELRRLHEGHLEDGKRIDRLEATNDDLTDRIDALEKALGMAVEALEMWRAGPFDSATRGGCISRSNFALAIARQTLGGKHD